MLLQKIYRSLRSVLLIFLVFCVLLLYVFTFWVRCCDFRIQTMFGSSLLSVVTCVARFSGLCILCYLFSILYRLSPPALIETETKDPIEEEILESVPKTMKTKAELLVRKMKADPSIAWSEKGELKYR